MSSQKRILVLGGSRFFGKRLVQKLIEEGHKVTLLNRGQREDSFQGEVQRIKCDRNDSKEMFQKLKNTSWDVVYDQICFDYEQAEKACDIFSGLVGKYILTSTGSVYEGKGPFKESAFNPKEYEVPKKISTTEDYGEAKRQAEVAFVEKASFPYTFLRIPVVLGPDDYTERLIFHVKRIMNGKGIYFPNLQAKVSFIHSADACKVLYFLSENDIEGPINAASPEPIALNELMVRIEGVVGKKLVQLKEFSEEFHSPYGVEKDWYMDCSLLKEQGLQLPPINEWIEKEIHFAKETLSSRS